MKKAIAILVLYAGACTLAARVPSVIAIRNARVVTVSGPVIERGTVVLRDGLIQDAGENVAVPADAWVIEGKGLTVYPGLIDSLTTLGIPEAAPAGSSGASPSARPSTPAPSSPQQQPAAPPARGPEDRPSTTSWIRAADLVSPSDRRIEPARNLGFTTAMTFPQRGIIAGQGAAVDLAGEKNTQMVVANPIGMYLTTQGGGFSSFPGSLFGVMAYLKQIYLDAGHYRAEKDAYAKNPRGAKRPDYDRALEGLMEPPRILLPAARVVEIDRMLRLAADLKQPAILYGAHQAYGAAGLLAKSNTPVLVSLKWPERDRNEDPELVESMRTLELREKAPSSPAALAKAGVKFAFYTDGVATARDLQRAVKRAVDAGLSQADLIRAFTLNAAEIYGLSDRLGSIEKGKIANLVVTEGELFQEKTKVKYVFVDGTKFEPLPEAAPAAQREEAAQ